MRWEHAFAKFPRRLSRGDEPDDAPTPHALSNSSRAMLDEAKSGNHDVHPYLADALEEGDNYADEDTLHLLRDPDYPQDRVHLYEHSPGKIRAVGEDDPDHPLNANPELHPVVGKMIPAYLQAAVSHTPDDRHGDDGDRTHGYLGSQYGVEDIHPDARRKIAFRLANFYRSLSPWERYAVAQNPEDAGEDFLFSQTGFGRPFAGQYLDQDGENVSHMLLQSARNQRRDDYDHLYAGGDGMIYS